MVIRKDAGGKQKGKREYAKSYTLGLLEEYQTKNANMFCKLKRKGLNKNIVNITISTLGFFFSTHGFLKPSVKRLFRDSALQETRRSRTEPQGSLAYGAAKPVSEQRRSSMRGRKRSRRIFHKSQVKKQLQEQQQCGGYKCMICSQSLTSP